MRALLTPVERSPVSEVLSFRAQVDIDYPHLVRRGSLGELGAHLASWLDVNRPIAIVSDETVAALHGQACRDALLSEGWQVSPILTFPPGEQSKKMETVSMLIDKMLDIGVHRRALLLALGGGVVCDTVGFVASTYMRGIDYVNVPTSLMAQVDAGIGGKVAVNHPKSKNFIGAFHHPKAVVIDPELTRTLPVEEIRNGMAEAVKVSVIHDPRMFEHIEQSAEALSEGTASGPALDAVIQGAVRNKIALLLPDPFEVDLKRVLNFGHTFAHPLEVAKGYSLRHGYAVSVGMALSTRIARNRGLIAPDQADRIFRVLTRLQLPVFGPPVDPVEVWEHAGVVRAVRANALHFVMPTGIGSTKIVDDLTMDEFLEAWAE